MQGSPAEGQFGGRSVSPPRNIERSRRVHGNGELWAAFIAVLVITLVYIVAMVLLNGIPASSQLFGHLIGVLGFLLMIVTETAYSLRKRSRQARWGRMSQWLNFHIFTGIVGPYMVLLHSAWNFNGVAGIAMLLTSVIVISGFIGRYIYTAVPRTADGVEIEASQLEEQILELQGEIDAWVRSEPDAAQALRNFLPANSVSEGSAALIFNRSILDWRQRWSWRRTRRSLPPKLREQADQMEKLAVRQQALRRQIASLAMARRMLALWHTIHVPIGMVLFLAATIHIVAAFYFATLLK